MNQSLDENKDEEKFQKMDIEFEKISEPAVAESTAIETSEPKTVEEALEEKSIEKERCQSAIRSLLNVSIRTRPENAFMALANVCQEVIWLTFRHFYKITWKLAVPLLTNSPWISSYD